MLWKFGPLIFFRCGGKVTAGSVGLTTASVSSNMVRANVTPLKHLVFQHNGLNFMTKMPRCYLGMHDIGKIGLSSLTIKHNLYPFLITLICYFNFFFIHTCTGCSKKCEAERFKTLFL